MRLNTLHFNLTLDFFTPFAFSNKVHDGKTAPAALVGPSSKINNLLIEYFNYEHEGYEYADMTDGSDFLPFLLEGIPAGGLLTGADEKKSMRQRTLFGGFANAPLDTCYHQSCDTLENVNQHALGLMAQAALYATTKLAKADNLREWLKEANVELSL